MKNHELMIHNLCTRGVHIIDSLLAPEQCHALRTTAEQMYTQGLFRHAKIGLKITSQHNKSIRTDEILWLEDTENHPEIQIFLLTYAN